MIALNDMLLSRAVRASPATEKQKARRNPATPENTANPMNNAAHGLPSSSALRGSASIYGNSNSGLHNLLLQQWNKLGMKQYSYISTVLRMALNVLWYCNRWFLSFHVKNALVNDLLYVEHKQINAKVRSKK